MKKTSNIVWGIVLIVIGIIFALNALELTNINIFFTGWWTLFIIIPSIIGLIKDSEKTWSLVCLIIGVVLLLGVNDKIPFDLIGKLLLPAILVIIGVSLLFKDTMTKQLKEKLEKAERGTHSYNAIFGGSKELVVDEFDGCEINAVFGGIDLDLTNAEIKKDCVIKASAIFGGITIKLPEDVKVKPISTSIFGSTDNDHKGGSKPTVFVEATNLFGGTDIK